VQFPAPSPSQPFRSFGCYHLARTRGALPSQKRHYLMARIMGIDYGAKKSGIAVTDPLQLIGSPLETVETAKLLDYLRNYLNNNEVETIVVGEPFYPDGNPAQLHAAVMAFVEKLKKTLPKVPIVLQDERYSSKEARDIILHSGKKKMARRDKTLVDKVSASLILRNFMLETKRWQSF
jgi:putative Holliday junction resolvase